MERYLLFTTEYLRFIESYLYISESFEKLASNMKEDFNNIALQTPVDILHL